MVLAVLLVPAPTISCAPRVGAHAGAGVDRPPLLVGVERRATRRWCRARRCPRTPASKYSWHSRSTASRATRAVGGERGDEGDVDTLEQAASRPRGYRAGQLAGPPKHVVEHRLGEPAGEGVLLATGGSSRARRPARWPPRPRGRTSGGAPGSGDPAPASTRADGVAGEPAEHHDHPHLGEQLELPDRGTAGSGRARRAWACWRAARSAPRPRRRRRVSSRPSSAARGGRLVGEAGAVQRGEEPVARAVAGEHAAGAVGAVGGGGEPGDEHPGARDRRTPGPGGPSTSSSRNAAALLAARPARATRRGAGTPGTRRSPRSSASSGGAGRPIVEPVAPIRSG